MIKTTRTPVKLYKWDDEDAPVNQHVEGSIKTILKACLVTGYGEGGARKEGLGWEIKFEEANKAVFQSKAKENDGWALSVDDSYRKDNGNQSDSHVRCNMMKNPSSFNGGIFGRPAHCGMSQSRFSDNGKWWLVGHERGFVLIASDSSSNSVCGCLAFSMFPSVVAADSANWVLGFSGAFGGYGYAGYQRKWALVNHEGMAPAGAVLGSKFSGYDRQAVDYPNPAVGGFVADDVFLLESNDWDASGRKLHFRGFFPGVMNIAENMPGDSIIPFGTIYTNLDGTSDRYLYYKTSFGSMLVNIDAWEM